MDIGRLTIEIVEKMCFNNFLLYLNIPAIIGARTRLIRVHNIFLFAV